MSKLLKTKRVIWGLICAVVTAVALVSYFSGSRYLAAVKAVEQTMAVQQAIDGTLSLLKDGETGARGYVLTGDERFLEPYESEQRGIGRHLQSLKELTSADPAQTERLQTLQRLTREKQAHLAEMVRKRRTDGLSPALAMVRTGLGKTIMDAIRVVCGDMGEREQALLLVRKQEARTAQASAVTGIGVGLVVTLLLAFLSLLTVNRDVEALKRTSKDLATSEAHFRLLAEHGSDLVRLVNLEGGANYVSPSVERLLGYGVEEFLSLPPLSLLHAEELNAGQKFLVDVVHGPSPPEFVTYRLRHKSGEYRYFETRWKALRDKKGNVTELHTVARDITERRSQEARLAVQADELRSLSLRDELTGLYNRRGFSEVAGQMLSMAARDGRPAALIFTDLNGMKDINDELGHDVGDEALKDAAKVLTAAHREADVVARLGGDEFAVFSLDFTAKDLAPLRLRLRELADLEAVRLGRSYRLSMSVGAAFMGTGARESLNALRDRADAAMYEQKNARTAAGNVTIVPPTDSVRAERPELDRATVPAESAPTARALELHPGDGLGIARAGESQARLGESRLSVQEIGGGAGASVDESPSDSIRLFGASDSLPGEGNGTRRSR